MPPTCISSSPSHLHFQLTDDRVPEDWPRTQSGPVPFLTPAFWTACTHDSQSEKLAHAGSIGGTISVAEMQLAPPNNSGHLMIGKTAQAGEPVFANDRHEEISSTGGSNSVAMMQLAPPNNSGHLMIGKTAQAGEPVFANDRHQEITSRGGSNSAGGGAPLQNTNAAGGGAPLQNTNAAAGGLKRWVKCKCGKTFEASAKKPKHSSKMNGGSAECGMSIAKDI